ncbi:hypothetical protein KXR83_04450 [Williamsia muralis]|uniref:hypothetical protein n=1 Tax=Williamsia marianensis TaxID=85044 RepID=UPI003F162419
MQVTLPAIAFGGSAGEYPLPLAVDGWDRWFRAVALGSSGHYAAAATELRRITTTSTDVVLLSLAASTRAAHLRQGGQHFRAVHHDAHALALLATPVAGSDAAAIAGPRVSAWCDALTGLAADDLGRGMFGAATRLLDRVDALLIDAHERTEGSEWVWHGRPALRSLWVRAELAMYTGDPDTAQEHSSAALAVVRGCPSQRHLIKTELIAAAAAASAGETSRAIERAQRVGDAAASAGQLPLWWASAMLLEALGAGGSPSAADLRHELAARGGAMR